MACSVLASFSAEQWRQLPDQSLGHPASMQGAQRLGHQTLYKTSLCFWSHSGGGAREGKRQPEATALGGQGEVKTAWSRAPFKVSSFKEASDGIQGEKGEPLWHSKTGAVISQPVGLKGRRTDYQFLPVEGRIFERRKAVPEKERRLSD